VAVIGRERLRPIVRSRPMTLRLAAMLWVLKFALTRTCKAEYVGHAIAYDARDVTGLLHK
jgi:hypothetical protein